MSRKVTSPCGKMIFLVSNNYLLCPERPFMEKAFYTNDKSLDFQSLNNKLVVATAIIIYPCSALYMQVPISPITRELTSLFDEYPGLLTAGELLPSHDLRGLLL